LHNHNKVPKATEPQFYDKKESKKMERDKEANKRIRIGEITLSRRPIRRKMHGDESEDEMKK
jgi:hypothetical protein